MPLRILLIFLFLATALPNSAYTADIGQQSSATRRINRAVALMGQFNFKDAHLLFQDLAEEFPQDTELQVNMAIALFNRQLQGDEVQALKILENVLQKDPQNNRARYCAALLLLHDGKLESALNYFAALREALPDDADLLYFTGKTYLQLNRYEEAYLLFKKAISADPYLSSGYYSGIMALRHLGRNDEANELINQYKKMRNNPRSRTAAFKYTKMGGLAQVVLPATHKKTRPPLSGKLFKHIEHLDIKGTTSPLQASALENSDLTVADINNDGYLDLFLPAQNKTDHNTILLGTEDVSSYKSAANHPLSRIPEVNSVLWGDINDDGLLDAYFLCRGRNRLFLQSQNNTWTDNTTKSGTGGKSLNTVSGALFDADHDGDLDIYTVNLDGQNELFNNNRNGTFRPLATKRGITGGKTSVAILAQDLDNDRDADIIVINRQPPHHVYLNDRLWNYTESRYFSKLTAQDIVSLTAGDTDSDGKIELYTIDSKGALLRWEAGSSTLDAVEIAHLDPPQSWRNSRMQLADCDGDGSLELLLAINSSLKILSLVHTPAQQIHNEELSSPLLSSAVVNTPRGPSVILQDTTGRLQILKPGSARFEFALVEVTGRKDKEANLRTNTSGIGSSILARTGSSWTALDTFYNDMNRGQSSQPVAIGLGGSNVIDFIQIDWPDGVFQTEMALAPEKLHVIPETQRQMSSCPVLFAWNGEKFEFVSDLLGVGGIGYAVGPGVYAEARPWEHFLLPPNFIQPKNGRIMLKMTEPMEEVEYLDSVEMNVYDLPPAWSMTMDERMVIMGPDATGKPIFYRKSIFPKSAVNDRGDDVIAAIQYKDLKAAPVGKLDRRFIGMLEKFHTLTLSFDQSLHSDSGTPVLIADGWVEYPYSQTSFAAWQAGAEYIAPSIEVRGQNGRWQTLLDQFGYPAGMPRQMAVPLHNMPDGVTELRISTNQEIYWDRLFVAFQEPCPMARKKTLALQSAILEDIGFPKRTDFPQRRPYYDYSIRNTNWDSRLLEGNYTRFGDVIELIDRQDKALAILGPGEGIHLEFSAPAKPPEKGWHRHYVLSSFGWCKDMDLYTNTGDTLAPLPGDPAREDVAKLHRKYNYRFLVGRR